MNRALCGRRASRAFPRAKPAADKPGRSFLDVVFRDVEFRGVPSRRDLPCA